MGRKSRAGKEDPRNLIIFILLLVVSVETYIIYTHLPRKAESKAVKKKIVFAPAIAKKESPAQLAPSPLIEPVPIPPPLKKPIVGRIAIIIDDWGYSKHCSELGEIKDPVTVAVLPELPHSREIAQCAHDQNKEVMLHLPLEPHKNLDRYPEDYIIKTSMNKSRVEALLKSAIDSVPFVDGVNNHMGSKATEDRRLMTIVFTKLKERKLFFVDSYVTSSSICRPLAKQMKILFAQRDVFLDNENKRPYIENQFAQLAREARKKGYAVGIGHDRELTLQIIKEQTALLKDQGFAIVTVRNLIQGN